MSDEGGRLGPNCPEAPNQGETGGTTSKPDTMVEAEERPRAKITSPKARLLSEDLDAYLRMLPLEDLTAEEKARILHEAWSIRALGGNPFAGLERKIQSLSMGWKGGNPRKMFGPAAAAKVDDFVPALETGRLDERD